MNCFVVKHLNVILIMNKINKPMSVVSRFINFSFSSVMVGAFGIYFTGNKTILFQQIALTMWLI
jgi:hypothetical protein